MALEQRIVEQYKPKSNGLFMGDEIALMSRDELLAVIGWFSQMQQERDRGLRFVQEIEKMKPRKEW